MQQNVYTALSQRKKSVSEIYKLLKKRRLFKETIREFFIKKGFEEIETPILIKSPNLDPNVEPIQIKELGYFLHTSPEYWMKKILSSDMTKKIFQVAKVFRKELVNDDLHLTEFELVEFYEKGKNYTYLIDLSMELLQHLAKSWEVESIRHKEKVVHLNGTFEIISIEELLKKKTGKTVKGIESEEEFWYLFATTVEPTIRGIEYPVFLIDWPSFSSTVAKEVADKPWLCERVELVVAGVEVMNGNTEITNPQLQFRKFEVEAKKRFGITWKNYIDEELIELMGKIESAVGAAIGFDRLFMLFECKDSIKEVSISI